MGYFQSKTNKKSIFKMKCDNCGEIFFFVVYKSQSIKIKNDLIKIPFTTKCQYCHKEKTGEIISKNDIKWKTLND